MKRTDTDLDRLYQLPLDEFTAARNALAKQLGDPAIKSLTKPPIAAWAVNQLYWKDGKAYRALVEAAGELRSAHKAVLGGRKGDLRAAGRAHDEAVEEALARTLAILADSGHPVTDATRQAVLNTLRALPADDPPGRLTRALQPGGFEMLAGLAIAPGKGKGAPVRLATPQKPAPRRGARDDRAEQEKRKHAEQAAAEALQAVREAEQAARRDEFEAARAARDVDRAARRLDSARERLAAVQQDVEEAETALAEADRARQAADRAASESAHRLDSLRNRLSGLKP